MKKSQYIVTTILILLIFGIGYYAYALNNEAEYKQKNSYDYSFTELVNCVNNIENYLAKVMVSRDSTHSAETLTKIWSDSNLSIMCIENIPFDEKGSGQSIKFLNQVADYSYYLSRKTINGEELTDEDFKNLKILYKYSLDLKDTLNEMALELNNGAISWEQLENTSSLVFTNDQEVNVFSSIESNFDDYEGLIYDGAYSDYITKNKKLGLIGEEIDKETAKNKLIKIFGKDNIEEIKEGETITGGNIDTFSFKIKFKNEFPNMDIEISKKGGWIVEAVRDRDVLEEKISNDDSIKIGKDFLEKIGYLNMKETYSLKQDNIVTINYAYEENNVLMYPDLIKVKVALDNGEVLGIEAIGYLNAHTQRDLVTPKISSEEAKAKLNPDLKIENERMSVIPLNNDKEAYCYEFKAKLEDKDFLIYINVETGKEEEILVLLETAGGILTI